MGDLWISYKASQRYSESDRIMAEVNARIITRPIKLTIDQNEKDVIVRETRVKTKVIVATATTQGPSGATGSTGPEGPQGISGSTSGDLRYEHNQLIPADTWIVDHNLGKRPSVFIEDSGGNDLIADIIHVNVNQLQIVFASETGGKAYLN